ncbi:MAG: SDR family oxidoreductase [Nanoarchaeota archaeon]
MRLNRELFQEPDLGEPHIEVPNLSEKVILVIGASRPSGFGYNFGKLAATEGNAKVILTASKERSEKRLAKYTSFQFDTAVIDVMDDSHYSRLENQIKRDYGRLDVVVVTPAFLNPEYLKVGTSWDDIPKSFQEECMAITVHPVRKILDSFTELLSSSQGVVYGISFPIKNLPSYTIGYAKEKLERLITDELAQKWQGNNIRVNVLSIGPFNSFSSSVIPGYQILHRLQELVKCQLPSLGYLVRESLCTISDNKTGHIYVIDGGLSKVMTKYEDKVNKIFGQFSPSANN